MSTESDLLDRIKNDRIKACVATAITAGWRVDRHKRAASDAVYLVWPLTKKAVMVPYANWDHFRSVARRMESISDITVLPRPRHHQDRKYVAASVDISPPRVEATTTPDLVGRLEELRKEHHDLSWEYKILIWSENNGPAEIHQAHSILHRIHMIEMTLLEMGQPLSERAITTTTR